MGVGVVRMLGPVQFVDAQGADVPLRSVSMRRLLALLAVSRSGPLRSEYLVDLLGSTPSAFRTSVSRLRSRIGETTIRSDPSGYRLDCRIDAQIFTDLLEATDGHVSLARIDQALGWWQGPALEEFRHEPWAEAEAARLDEMRLVAVERRVEQLIAQARCGEAVAAAEMLVAAHPFRDRARGLLIEALAGDGRQAESLRAFQTYRLFLAEECGTEPSAHVCSIEQRVAAGWDDLGRATATAPGARELTATPPRVEIPFPGALDLGAPIAGRVAQLALLEADLAAARHGSIRVARLSGDAGIGKTTLLAAFAHACRESASILYGRCDETSVPLQPFRSIVRTLVAHVPVTILAEHVDVHGGELARLAPQLHARTWAPGPGEGGGEIEQFHLFEAVADLVRRAASTSPVVLLLDDLHWAERTALLLLRHLVRALVDAPVFVVITTRGAGDRLPSGLREVLSDIDGVPTRRIELGALEDSELVELTASVLAVDLSEDPASMDSLKEQTGGNPLYASQLLRHLKERGETALPPVSGSPAVTPDGVVPPGLVDVLWRRVHELGPAAAAVLQACSVLAPVIRPDVLEALFDTDAVDVASSIDGAVAAGLLYEIGSVDSSLRFTHSLVAQALYGEIPGAERRALHRSALGALASHVQGPGHASPIELTVHATAAGDHTSATRWAVLAGESALENLAPTEASRWFRTALDHAAAAGASDAERAALEVQLGASQLRAGDPEARTTLLAAAERARRTGADRALVDAVLAQDRGMMRIGSIDEELLAMIEAALEVAERADEGTFARLLALHALHLVHTSRVEERLGSARRAVELIERSEDSLLLPKMISSLLFALSGPGTLDLRRDLALRAIIAADRSEDPHLRFWTARAAHFVAIEAADPPMAAAQVRRMEEIATTIPETRLRWVLTTASAFTALMEARLDDAEALIDRALGLGMQVGDPDAMSVYAAQFFVCRSFAGRYDELLPLLDEANRATPGVRPFELAHAITLAATGHVDRPSRLLRAAAASEFADVPHDYLWMTSIIGYAVLAIELEDTTSAAPLFELLDPFGDQVAFTGATSQGHIGAYLGKLASLLGRHDVADAHLARSLAVARSFGWRYHEATTLVALAHSRWRRSGVLDQQAMSWLSAASDTATECNLASVRSQVNALRRRD